MVEFSGVWQSRDGKPVCDLRGWERAEGRIETNGNSETHWGANLLLRGQVDPRINLMTHELALYADGEPYCVLTPSRKPREVSGGTESFSLDFVGILKRVALAKTRSPYTVPKGTVITARIRAILTMLGIKRMQITESTAVLPSPMVFDAGTSWLTVINELAGRLNYWGLRVSPTGFFEIYPYVVSTKRPTVHRFIAGDGSLLLSAYSTEEELLEVPNRYTVFSQPYGKDKAITAVAENRNAKSRYSIPARDGLIIDEVELKEFATQKAADDYAARALSRLTSQFRVWEVEHAWVKDLCPHMVVEATTQMGDQIKAAVLKQTVNTATGWTKSTWREVVSLV